MTRRYKIAQVGGPLRNASPEQLLLLTIFGGEQLQHYVDDELDRRALARPSRETEFLSPLGGNRAA